MSSLFIVNGDSFLFNHHLYYPAQLMLWMNYMHHSRDGGATVLHYEIVLILLISTKFITLFSFR